MLVSCERVLLSKLPELLSSLQTKIPIVCHMGNFAALFSSEQKRRAALLRLLSVRCAQCAFREEGGRKAGNISCISDSVCIAGSQKGDCGHLA